MPISTLAPELESARRYAQKKGTRDAERRPTKAARSLPELAVKVDTYTTETSDGARCLGYAEGILSRLSASTRCQICGRDLTDPLSVKRGIGPDCYAKLKADAELDAAYRKAREVLGQPAIPDTEAPPSEEVVYVLPRHEYRARALRDGRETRLELGIETGAYYPKSPDGHSYGYNGSGPNQLAFDVLTDYLGEQPPPALRLAFVRRFVAGEGGDVWTVRASEIRGWLVERAREVVDA